MSVFNPETVERWLFEDTFDGSMTEMVVASKDYDQLLDLYKELKWKYEDLCK